ncbi:Beta-1 4-N-acetylgalactosaminyltransferase bre-4 [Fasciola hepatica]|uniref:Beta-1 4-N-acetylgalactosaminyltransferase bre-4 n=1 Tax=Fasciola hepatica TaxID=6192 RepID=A0A4E0RMZ6_FASHE|nr:Beta-1 4-N-acetylgalactosaminyltransferase bre-4 [Fasciola hepatica]
MKHKNMTETVMLNNPLAIQNCFVRTKQRLVPVGKKSLLTSMCAISILLTLASIFYWYPEDMLPMFSLTSSDQEEFSWLSPEDLDQCAIDTALSTMNFTLNLTIPDWMELLSEYVPIKRHESGWTVYRLPNNQYYLDNQTIIKSNKTANHSKIATFGQDLLLARVNLSLALWSPILCEPQESTAIIIPYRNREEHLRALLHTLPAFLIHQNVRFTIFVIEQMSNTRFNRALLFNVGFIESKRIGNFDCYIFHDVDLLPADLRVPYSCGSQPVHLAASMDKFGYR